MDGFWIGLGVAVAGFFIGGGYSRMADHLHDLGQEINLDRHNRLRGDRC